MIISVGFILGNIFIRESNELFMVFVLVLVLIEDFLMFDFCWLLFEICFDVVDVIFSNVFRFCNLIGVV